MHELFRGHSGAHGTYRDEEFSADKNKQEIKKSARTLRVPATVELWDRHLDGDYHLGIITITERSMVWWAAVDIDDYNIDHTVLVRDITEMSLPAVVCKTKSGGAHVYMFFSEEVPAADAMQRMRDLATALGHSGCEVFPKQTRVVSEEQGLGNWINMPYFGITTGFSRCHAVKPDGLGMTLSQFIAAAQQSRITARDLQGLQFQKRNDSFEDSPPCLEHLAKKKLIKGEQNIALFSFAVLAKKKYPEAWRERIMEWSTTLCDPPHEALRIRQMITSLEKTNYNYKCHDVPCSTHCNMGLCRSRKYGIGQLNGAAVLDSISILSSEPPLFYVGLKTGDTVECDGSDLLNPRAFQILALDQVHAVLPLVKAEDWLRQVKGLVETAKIIAAPPEVGATGQLMELIERFCTDRHSAESREEILSGKPWRDGDQMVWFRLRDLTEFLERNKFKKLKDNQITDRIRRMGGRNHFFNMSGKGVNVWGVPVDQLVWTTEPIPTPTLDEGPV